MPELPDIVVYVEALERFTVGQTLEKLRVRSVSLLRTYDPPVSAVEGKKVLGFRRIGKRIVFEFEDDLFIVLHLMVAGRLRWVKKGQAVPNKVGLCAFDFPDGTLMLTEQGTKKRASLHIERGIDAVLAHDRGGIEPLTASRAEFAGALIRENRTMKRGLTDPRIFSGIGNAYSDEILHKAKLSPVKRTKQLTEDEITRLYEATQSSLLEWTERLRAEVGDGFPDKVTAFRKDMVVHGKYAEPCPVCGSKVQRIVYASNETNYCATCQTDGKLLADRSLSRLLKDDWPKTIDELE
ncbi:MAG: formamidopyrimidine-DNA glycosylase [Acidimicrobiia bacterium]|nr:formamidopyrimidine-DNA glycosylase [Acidimicrobiia bacterium]